MNGHPQTVSVPLGSWANLTCTVRVNSCKNINIKKNIVTWIVWTESGGYNVTGVGESKNITGAEVQCTEECIGNSKKAVTLNIKTSSTTVVQCHEYKLAGRKNFYSGFAVVIVESRVEDHLLH